MIALTMENWYLFYITINPLLLTLVWNPVKELLLVFQIILEENGLTSGKFFSFLAPAKGGVVVQGIS